MSPITSVTNVVISAVALVMNRQNISVRNLSDKYKGFLYISIDFAFSSYSVTFLINPVYDLLIVPNWLYESKIKFLSCALLAFSRFIVNF